MRGAVPGLRFAPSGLRLLAQPPGSLGDERVARMKCGGAVPGLRFAPSGLRLLAQQPGSLGDERVARMKCGGRARIALRSIRATLIGAATREFGDERVARMKCGGPCPDCASLHPGYAYWRSHPGVSAMSA